MSHTLLDVMSRLAQAPQNAEQLARHLAIPLRTVHNTVQELRRQRLCYVSDRTPSVTGPWVAVYALQPGLVRGAMPDAPRPTGRARRQARADFFGETNAKR